MRSLKYPEPFHGHAVWSGDKTAINTVNKFLTEPQQISFAKSVFGQFVGLRGSLTISSSLMHSLLRLQLEDQTPSDFRILVGGQMCKFTLSDFCLITGLKCSDGGEVRHQVEGEDSSLLHKYFDGRKAITVDALSQFMADDEKKELLIDEDEDAVKLAMIYFCSAGLLGKRGEVNIDLHVIQIIENNQLAESYCWGNKVFEATITSLKCHLKKREKVGNKLESPSIYLVGFPLAFQVWALEKFPFLRAYTKCHGPKVPRMLRWQGFHPKHFSTLFKEITSVEAVPFLALKPKEGEEFNFVHVQPRVGPKRKQPSNVDASSSVQDALLDAVAILGCKIERKIDEAERKFEAKLSKLNDKLDQKFGELNEKIDAARSSQTTTEPAATRDSIPAAARQILDELKAGLYSLNDDDADLENDAATDVETSMDEEELAEQVVAQDSRPPQKKATKDAIKRTPMAVPPPSFNLLSPENIPANSQAAAHEGVEAEAADEMQGNDAALPPGGHEEGIEPVEHEQEEPPIGKRVPKRGRLLRTPYVDGMKNAKH